MTDEKIPLNERDEIVLLADGEHVLWVVGHRISNYYKVGSDTKKILIAKYNEPPIG
jgi:tRNA(Ile)-lysidine synthase